MNKRFWGILSKIIWVAFFIVCGLTYYVNHYLPHGPSYSTGEIICQNDGRGPCGEEYKEDLRGINIPNWAKLFRNDGWILLWIGLGAIGMIASGKANE